MIGLSLYKDVYTKETLEGLHNIEDECEVKMNEIQENETILKTLLSACETYEQEMDVLKSRGIVNSKFIMEFEK